MTELAENLDLDLIRQKIEGSLYFFAKGVLRLKDMVPDVHGRVCETLQSEGLRKMFVLPRGWFKSSLCSIAYPIWEAIKNPNIRILIAQNSQNNARKKLKSIRDYWESNQLLRALYPHLLPGVNSTWSADSLCLTRTESHPEGTFECCGVKSQVISRHYDFIIEDDTVAPDFDELGEESLAPTVEDVKQGIGWHRLTPGLYNNPKTTKQLVVGTRWYEQDLISWIRDNEPEYEIVTRACREDEDGNPDPNGRLTFPERFDDKVLRQLEAAYGPYMFNCLCLNTPVRTGDMIFREEWFQYYDELPPRQSLMVWTCMDAATDPELSASKEKDTDYCTVMTTGKDLITGDIYVLEYWRERCNPGDHIDALFDQVLRWKPIEVGYEDTAYQKSLDYWIKNKMRSCGKHFVLTPVKRVGGRKASKNTHIMGLQPIFAAGFIKMRRYMKILREELLVFPRGGHDDLADTLAMHHQFWKRTKAKREVEELSFASHTLDAAIQEFESRVKKGRNLILAPMDCGGQLNFN